MRHPVLLLILPLLLGCANHVRLTDVRETEQVRNVLEDQVRIVLDARVLETERLRARVVRDRVIEERTDQVHTVVQAYVPWAATRELFEVPVGLLTVSTALLAHFADVLVAGALPNEALQTYTAWTVAALNPVLNTETETRTRQRDRSREVVAGAPREVSEREPLAEQRVEISFPGAAPFVVRAGSQGAISVHLLDVPVRGLPAPARQLRLRVVSEEGSPRVETSVWIDRRLARRVYDASRALEAARADDPSARTLSDVVYQLDRAGFGEYSLKLEDELHRRFRDDPDRLEELRAELDRLYADDLSFPASIGVPEVALPAGEGAPE